MKWHVYWCFGDEELLYIGMTRNLKARMSNHKYYSFWYPLLRKTYSADFRNKYQASLIEIDSIREEQPKFNVCYKDRNSWKWVRKACQKIGRFEKKLTGIPVTDLL